MLRVLSNRTYRHLLAAQIVALLGTGLATVALGLLAFDLAGGNAGAVLGTALAIKMIAYVAVAPVASAFTEILPRRATLVALDLVRAAIAALLPFVTEVWQVYLLIFVLQSASAAFTPAFQADWTHSRAVAPGAHALIIMDGAGYHHRAAIALPGNISILKLPPYSPELNPIENVWQYLRQNFLAHRILDDYDAIVDACFDAWNALAQMPERIKSITQRDWANKVSA